MISALRAHLRRLSKDTESGQAMVEFVIVFPVQLLLTLSIIQFAFVAHAHIVVGQAAFQGARAGAVADVPASMGAATADPTKIEQAVEEAGNRAAARVCALLTSEEKLPSTKKSAGRDQVQDGQLRWRKSGSAWYGFSEERQIQAYELLETDTKLVDDGWIVCDVKFEYIMQIPVANHFFAPFSGERNAYGGQEYTTFMIRRVGFVPTPWKSKGIEE